MFNWNVTLYNNGAKLTVQVQARNQREALQFGAVLAPGYRACNAQRA